MWPSIVSRIGLAALAIVLSAFVHAQVPAESRPAGVPPPGYVVALLAVTVNSEALDEPLLTLRDAQGRVLVAASELVRWRLRLPAVDGVEFSGERFIALAVFNGMVVNIDEAAQAMKIEAPAVLFQSTAIDALQRPGPVPQRTSAGGFFNYTLLASRVETTTASGSFELGAFGRFGTLNTTGVGSHTDESSRFTRLDTTWTYAMPERMSTVRAGDAVSRAGAWGSALRFGGVQFATDFATQPNLVLTPGQFAAGQATVPSTVDVFINNALVTQQQVKPGPFSITNIPPITGSGNVTLIVRDELGREQVITRPFYASQTLLRPGLTDFSVDLGWVRENYGIASADYGPWIASGTYRRGLTDRVTGEVHGEALAGLANAGVALSMLVADWGVLSMSAAGGHNRDGNGGRFSAGFERRSRGLSFNVQGTWVSPKFRLAGETDPSTLIAHEWLASADYTFGRYGTVSLAYVDRAYRSQPSARVGTLGYTLSLDQWGYVSASVSRTRAIESSTMINFLWTMPLGTTTTITAGHERVRTNASDSGDSRGSRSESSVSIQRNLPVGDGWGYRVRASDNDAYQGQLTYQNRYGTYSAEVARNAGQTGERVTASGGIGMISGTTFASRLITESFGLVRLPGYPDVRVYAENREIGRTDRYGELIVPRLLPYQRNSLRIDQADIPLDAEFDVLQQNAVPYARSGVVVDFNVKPSRGALVRIVEPNGSPVPPGAQVLVQGQANASPIALDGEAYLTGLSMRNRARVTWTDRACEFDFEYPQGTDPQPRLGPFVCRTVQ